MISDPKFPTALAKKYQEMLDEYIKLQNQANDAIFSTNTYDIKLIDKIIAEKNKIEEYNRKIFFNIHYVEPEDPLTFH